MGLNILEVKVANQLIELMERFGVAFDEIGVEVSDEHSSLTQQRAQLQQEAAAAKELSNEQAFKDRQQDIIDIDKVLGSVPKYAVNFLLPDDVEGWQNLSGPAQNLFQHLERYMPTDVKFDSVNIQGDEPKLKADDLALLSGMLAEALDKASKGQYIGSAR